MKDIRAEVVDYLRAHVVGPYGGPVEVLQQKPYKRYLMGTLYPANAESRETLSDEVEEATGGSLGEEIADDPVTLANSWMPSSLGVSFYFGGKASLTCRVWGASYESRRSNRRQVFARSPIAEHGEPETVTVDPPAEGATSSRSVLGERAKLDVLWRQLGGGHLVTVTLRNIQEQKDPHRVDPELCIHQAGLECAPLDGTIHEYPSVDFLSRNLEDAQLRLLHRRAKVFAIGHGCAADWELVHGADTCLAVRSELMPRFEVAPVVTGGEDDQVLSLARLADESVPTDDLRAQLNGFVDSYKTWIDNLPSAHTDIPSTLYPARDSLLERLVTAEERMRKGIDVLTKDPVMLRAFRLANLAMLMQMRHAKEDLAGTRRVKESRESYTPDYLSLSYKWFPFQLAFQLLSLASVANSADKDRSVVDLLGFPTGGGKTEAYLGLAAFQIFLRRLRQANGGAGTTVITRYTLRLLTAQQFQRAASLVCALELIRRRFASEMGAEPITIGLWVGEGVTPNKYTKAAEKFSEILEAPNPTNPFQLEQCPWCGTELIPRARDDDVTTYGVRATQSSFAFFCPRTGCEFHEWLPVAVVDEQLFDLPPTFLLATVDKFARLAWEERGGVFFGSNVFPPPSLIIQDEMHLLSGPLGTTVGLYETAVEALIELHGVRPKIIASTATIRDAAQQAWALFGRKVQLFPPSGLIADDSYFAKTDTTRPGRLYLGLMSQSHTPHTTIVQVAAALLQVPLELSLTDRDLDSYWTLVAYHNSLRELGRTITLARDDIPSRMKVIATAEDNVRDISADAVVELTSNVSGYELPAILARLKRSATEADAVSVLASTNMLSVGVDISRLTLMLMNGQPKTTSEYIQATSRVGRGDVPGLVITLYVSTKPRDRSHYESFVPYHSALYRFVEPTSVTPFAVPSRQRALHAALVILVRHGCQLSGNADATNFRAKLPGVEKAIQQLVNRAKRVDFREADATASQLTDLAEQWERLAIETEESGRSLYYRASAPHTSLLRDFGAKGTGWETLHSMRNVDRQCHVGVIGEDR
jgi:Helicase conserved C-terminal domain